MRGGICGFGRMGLGFAMQALEKSHEVVGYDPGGSEELQAAGGTEVESITALADALPWARTVAPLRHEYGKHPLQGRAGSDS